MLTINIHTTFGGKRVPCKSVNDCVLAWESFRDAHGVGASDMRSGCGIVSKNGKRVAKVSYNGRVWPVKPWTPEQQELSAEDIAKIDA